jgi:PAS domain S-box-containing protein
MTLLELRRALSAKSQSEGRLSLTLGALREREEALSRIAAVVESSDDAIITKSLDGTILSWNASAERIFGYAPHEIIGKSILELIPAEIQHEEPSIIDRLKKGQRIEHYETVRLGKDGRRIDISLTVSPVKDANGKVIAASKIARDVTEERKRQQAARESETRFRAELERQVNERTASLQEAVAQMEEFSYSVSHDLRAPLRALQGYATALLEDYQGKIDDEGQEYLRLIVSAAHRMERLTHDVLVYSKIPRTSFKMHAVDLEKLVSDIVRQIVPDQTKEAKIAIESPLLPVLGNESFLSQSISNLIDNAVKFVAKERVLKVHIWTELRGEQVRLWVEDNGIGILPEHQGRVWGMFERVHPRHLYDGTGIGLAIVRKTVERMNGTMGLESDGATGSKFWIQLPAANQP